ARGGRRDVRRAEQRMRASSVLCRLEVQAGVRRREERDTDLLLAVIEWWPVDDPVLDRAAALARTHGPGDRGVGAVDYCLAATADLLDAQLATTNVKHFPMFPGLQAPYQSVACLLGRAAVRR